MADREGLESTDLPARRLVIGAAIGFAAVLLSLAAMFGLYTLWANGPQVQVRPKPLANASAPVLDTYLFRTRALSRPPDPDIARAQSYRWRDKTHARVNIPIGRAMALEAARGAQGFDPVANGTTP